MMKNKETLIILHPHFTIPGGAGKVALELGKRLSKTMEVVVIAQKINPEYIEEYPEIIFESLDGPVTSSLGFWLLFPFWQKKTFQIIDRYKKKSNIRLLCNVFPANWIGLPYKRKNPKVKVLWYCHEPSAFIHVRKWRDAIASPTKRLIANLLCPILSIIDKKIVRSADIIFSNSKFTSTNIEKIYGRKSEIIYPGVDTARFFPIDFAEKENYLLTVGRLTKFKNIDMLLRAFAQVKSAQQLILKIVGDGEEKNNLQTLATELQIQDRVFFLSGISDEDLATIYAKAKLFIICSKDEPFGIVPIEAMASGTAVIAGNSGGLSETILDGITGKLIKNPTVATLADSINQLISNKKGLLSLSANAATHARKCFDWTKSSVKLEGLL